MAGSSLPVNLLSSSNILRVLNTRYILWPDQLGAPADRGLPAAIVDNLQRVSQTTIGGRPYESVYMFTDLPRARLVTEAVVLPDDQAVPFMLGDSFGSGSPGGTGRSTTPRAFRRAGAGSVEWLERGNNEMRLQVSTDQPALLVLADNWFPAWKARVGDRDTPILRANHTLRAVPIPEGDHVVEIRYDSAQLSWSFRLTLCELRGGGGARRSRPSPTRPSTWGSIGVRRFALRSLQIGLTIIVTWFILDRVGVDASRLRGLNRSVWKPDLIPFTMSLSGPRRGVRPVGRAVGADRSRPRGPGPSSAYVCSAVYGRESGAISVPGKVWQIAGLAYMAKGEGISASVATGAAVLGQGVALLAATLIGVGALFGPNELWRVLGWPGSAVGLGLAVGIIGCSLYPPTLSADSCGMGFASPARSCRRS